MWRDRLDQQKKSCKFSPESSVTVDIPKVSRHIWVSGSILARLDVTLILTHILVNVNQSPGLIWSETEHTHCDFSIIMNIQSCLRERGVCLCEMTGNRMKASLRAELDTDLHHTSSLRSSSVSARFIFDLLMSVLCLRRSRGAYVINKEGICK